MYMYQTRNNINDQASQRYFNPKCQMLNSFIFNCSEDDLVTKFMLS